ncbi:integrase [Sagittula sp. S175]|uniref:integrase n=1 Tax=Sagittula sp. S175 TaxID=3415129 RepID=UPI003C7D2FFE
MKDYFAAQRDRYLETLNDKGLSPAFLEAAKEEIAIYQDATKHGFTDLSDEYLSTTVQRFRSDVGLSEAVWSDNADRLQSEVRHWREAALRAVLEAAERFETFSLSDTPKIASRPPAPALAASTPLGAALDDFLLEHSRQWAEKTTKQNAAYLNILVEHFGRERLLATISKQDASEVKKVLQQLPSSRNTQPALKDLPLSEVIKVLGQKKISPKTINSHIQMFKMFFDWAERHGHSPNTLFEGMKVKKEKDSASERKPFTPDQLRLIYTELTENPSGLVRKDSHKWGMLLGMFTGSRLNEICQLDIADVKQDGDTWFLNITDEGDDTKSVKSKAGRRKVPLHTELIRLGFLDFVESRRSGTRLFRDFSYSANGGYGRNLGRWCNESFLPKLGIKQPGLALLHKSCEGFMS